MHEQQGVATVANERRVVALAPGGVEFLESLLGKSAAEGLGEADILRITQDLMELAGTTCQETSVVLQCTLHGIAPEVISEQLKMPRAKVTRRLAELRRSIKTIEQITPTMTRGYIQANAATPAPAVAEPAPDAPHDVAAPIDVLEEEVAPTSPVPRQLGDVALLSVQLELGEEEDEQYEDEVIAAEPDDL